MKTRTAVKSTRRHMIFFGLFGAVVFSILLYGYFLNRILINGVYVENNQKIVVSLRSEVGVLEQQYFEAEKGITLTLAKDLGFTEAKNATYLSRGATALSLSH